MIGFLEPLFLLGLGAIAVPIALHLLFRRRVPVMEFPLTRLVARAERSRQPRKRLNRVLLLCARVAALALLALALARMTVGADALVSAEGPMAVGLVIDDSLSTSAASADGETVFAAGMAAARRVIETLPPGSQVAVVRGSRPDDGSGLLDARRAGLDALVGVRPTSRLVRLGPAISAALRTMSSSPLEDRRLVLVTDLARHAFEGLDLDAGEGRRVRAEVIAPAPAPGVNRSVSGLEAEARPDGRLTAELRVSSWGGADGEVRTELRTAALDGPARVAARATVSATGGAAIERRYDLAAPGEGFVVVTGSIGEDVLPGDDVRHAVAHVARRLRVLVVDGDPQNLSFGSETFYLERALAPGVGLDFAPEFVAVSELRPGDFEDVDLVMLCNVRELSVERSMALEEAVRRGVGLVVSLGDLVDQAAYNGRLASVLPATLGQPRRADGVGMRSSLAQLDLPRARVRGWFGLEPDPGATVLTRLEGGEPLVIEGALGEGRVVLISTTIDRDWTDMPISPHFLRFVHELLRRVSVTRRATPLPPVTVGEPVSLAAIGAGLVVRHGEAGVATAVGPDGVHRETAEPGIHVVELDGEPVAAFAVVTDNLESDSARLTLEELERLLSGVAEMEGGDGERRAPGGSRPLHPELLAALVGMVAVESWLARRAA